MEIAIVNLIDFSFAFDAKHQKNRGKKEIEKSKTFSITAKQKQEQRLKHEQRSENIVFSANMKYYLREIEMVKRILLNGNWQHTRSFALSLTWRQLFAVRWVQMTPTTS